MARHWPAVALLLGLALAAAAGVEGAVTYDRKAVLIDGKRRILFSGSIHYPRSTPEVNRILPSKASVSFFYFSVGGGEFLSWAV